MRVALWRAACASAPVLGLAKAYSATLANRRPGSQGIDRRGHAVEIAPQPADTLGRRGIGGRPDVGALKVRAARVGIAGALDDREPAGVEDGAQVGQARVQAERVPGAVGPDLENVAGRDREVWTTREVLLISVGNERAQPVVAAAQVEHDQVAPRSPLRTGNVGQK